jgi:predicted nucleic-acid-binding protein
VSRRVHLDANVILRFLRNDDPDQSPIAVVLFDRAQNGLLDLVVSPVTVLEVFYVLATSYGMPRPDVAKILHTLLASDLVRCEDKGITIDALQRITSNKVSFGDAYLMATASQSQEEIATFDKGIASLKDIRIYPLASLVKAKSK